MQFERIRRNRDLQFLTLNAIGWAGYDLAWMVSVFYAGKPASYYFAMAVLSMLGFIITIPLRYLYRGIWHTSVVTRIIAVITASFLCSVIWLPPKNWAHGALITGQVPSTTAEFFSGLLLVHYVFISWSCLYFGIKFYQGMEEASQRALKATALAHEAQLKMLRYQLNPHFLFNTLNAISTLVLDKQPERAEQMINRLSNFLRHSLDNDPLQKVPLAQEIATLELYLDIEKVRFEDRLKLDFQVGELEGRALVPSLILQPLVENSIKYAVAQSETGGTISFRTQIHDAEVLLELQDTGPGIDLIKGQLPAGRGVGIRNTRERLIQIYNDSHSFSVSNITSPEGKPSGLQISIRLPYEVNHS